MQLRLPRWVDIPPVSEQVDWGEAFAVHRIDWRAGELYLKDHDTDSELALEALGGEACPCVKLLRVWRAASSAAFLLPSLFKESEGSALEIFKARDQFIGLTARLQHSPFIAPEDLPGYKRRELPRLKEAHDPLLAGCLPKALRLRLWLTIIDQCARRWSDANFRDDTLHNFDLSYRGLLRPLIGTLLDLPKGSPGLRCHIAAPGEEPAHLRSKWGDVELRLPVTWGIEVYAAGLAIVDLMVVLAVQETPNPDELVAQVVEVRELMSANPASPYRDVRLTRKPDRTWRLLNPV